MTLLSNLGWYLITRVTIKCYSNTAVGKGSFSPNSSCSSELSRAWSHWSFILNNIRSWARAVWRLGRAIGTGQTGFRPTWNRKSGWRILRCHLRRRLRNINNSRNNNNSNSSKGRSKDGLLQARRMRTAATFRKRKIWGELIDHWPIFSSRNWFIIETIRS